jgi:serine O-acetyltransferase
VSERYSLREVASDVVRDIDSYLGFWSEYHAVRRGWRHRVSALVTPSLLACALYRAARWLWSNRWPQLGLALARLNCALTRVTIHPACRIGGGLYIPHPSTGIVFSGHAGRDLRLFAGSAAGPEPELPFPCFDDGAVPRFGDGVSLGAKAYVQGRVNVGSRARIGFNAWVRRDIPDDGVVVARQRARRPR